MKKIPFVTEKADVLIIIDEETLIGTAKIDLSKSVYRDDVNTELIIEDIAGETVNVIENLIKRKACILIHKWSQAFKDKHTFGKASMNELKKVFFGKSVLALDYPQIQLF